MRVPATSGRREKGSEGRLEGNMMPSSWKFVGVRKRFEKLLSEDMVRLNVYSRQ